MENINPFQTQADRLIEIIDNESKFDRNDPEVGYTYRFHELGLAFWRPNILTEDDLNSERFLSLSKDIQEDELKSLYFESISVYPLSSTE